MNYLFKKSQSREFLSIDKNMNVVLHSPYKVSEERAQQLFLLKKDWIDKTLKKVAARTKKFSLEEGSEFFLFEHKLIVSFENVSNFFVKDEKLFIPTKYQDNPTPYVVAFVKQNAEIFLKRRLGEMEAKFGFGRYNFKLSNAQSYWGLYRWGKKEIALSWRLLFYKLEIIDYVIIHELCHGIEQNHSPKFWAQVEKRCPKYKEYRQYIKNSNYMNILE